MIYKNIYEHINQAKLINRNILIEEGASIDTNINMLIKWTFQVWIRLDWARMTILILSSKSSLLLSFPFFASPSIDYKSAFIKGKAKTLEGSLQRSRGNSKFLPGGTIVEKPWVCLHDPLRWLPPDHQLFAGMIFLWCCHDGGLAMDGGYWTQDLKANPLSRSAFSLLVSTCLLVRYRGGTKRMIFRALQASFSKG